MSTRREAVPPILLGRIKAGRVTRFVRQKNGDIRPRGAHGLSLIKDSQRCQGGREVIIAVPEQL